MIGIAFFIFLKSNSLSIISERVIKVFIAVLLEML